MSAMEKLGALKGAKRSRKSGKRSKGGCLTCKVRRVKCDEQKPTCRRCDNFGIRCDGYPMAVKWVKKPVIVRNSLLLPKPRAPIPVHVLACDNELERRYLSLWHHALPTDIAFQFDVDLWAQITLQSVNIPAVRHGIVAIAALNQAFVLAKRDRDTAAITFDLKEGNTDYIFAVQQYNKAIRLMSNDLAAGTQNIRTTLITCLMMQYFEAFHGNYGLSSAQIRTGTALIAEWRKTQQKQPITGYSSPNPDIVEDYLVQAFGRLELQACHNLYTPNLPSPERLEELRLEGNEVVRNIPKTFSNLESARINLELIIRRLQYYQTSSIEQQLNFPRSQGKSQAHAGMSNTYSYASTSQSSPSSYETSGSPEQFGLEDVRQGIHQVELNNWSLAFESMMKKFDMDETVGAMILRLHHKTAAFSMNVFDLNPMVADAYASTMWDIVVLSKRILEKCVKASLQEFSPDLGVILPLYLVGLKCRVPHIRRKIIGLLLAYPRREGLWDSVMIGKVIEWVQAIEEKHLMDGLIPRFARIDPIYTTCELQERKVEVIYLYQRSTDEGFVPTEKSAVIRF